MTQLLGLALALTAIMASCATQATGLPQATLNEESVSAENNQGATAFRWSPNTLGYTGLGDPVVLTLGERGMDLSGTDKAGGIAALPDGTLQAVSQSDIDIEDGSITYGDPIVYDDGTMVRPVTGMQAKRVTVRPSTVLAQRVEALEQWQSVVEAQQPTAQAAIAAEREKFIESVRTISPDAASVLAKLLGGM
jgi:hypothetical protein